MASRQECTTGNGPFNSESALELIREVLCEMVDESHPVEHNTRIDMWIQAVGGTDSVELLELTFRLEKAIGVRLTNQDWDDLAGWNRCGSREEWEVRCAKSFTFGRLAELLAQRASITRIEPMTILGSTCLAAGAFKTIEQEVKRFTTDLRRFAPSTPILDRVNPRRLPKFWERIRLHNPSRVPHFGPARGRGIAAFPVNKSGFAVCLFAAVFCVTALGDYWGLQAIVGDAMFCRICGVISLLASIVPAIVFILVCDSINTFRLRKRAARGMLPAGVKTFGDLARLIASERGGWCEECGYDLTGVTSAACPECGGGEVRLTSCWR